MMFYPFLFCSTKLTKRIINIKGIILINSLTISDMIESFFSLCLDADISQYQRLNHVAIDLFFQGRIVASKLQH